MHTAAVVLALASVASAKLGFNYGSTFTTGAAKQQSDFEAEFSAAQNLKGAKGFTSARLYTTVQADSASDPIAAIPAAIKTKTSLLLGLWASAGDEVFSNEIIALKAAIEQYGDDFTSIVDGISIGSEDLYRASPQGIAAGSNVGTGPDVLVKYIKQLKQALAGTALAKAPLGHVDTWTAWENGSNSAVVDELDWIGMDAYPYFQSDMPNGIDLGKSLFDAALATTQSAAGGKEVWITETGYPVSGKVSGDATPSVKNAEQYWQDVGCPMFDSMNVWWYTLQDAEPDTPNPSFGLLGTSLTGAPLFDLSCDDVPKESSSSSSSSSASATSTVSKPHGTATKSADSSATPTGSSSASSGASGYSSSAVASGYPTPPTSGASQPTSGSGSGSGSGATSSPASPTSTSVPQGAASGIKSGGLGAAFVAIMAAIFTL